VDVAGRAVPAERDRVRGLELDQRRVDGLGQQVKQREVAAGRKKASGENDLQPSDLI
jgi:hypothetical protein